MREVNVINFNNVGLKRNMINVIWHENLNVKLQKMDNPVKKIPAKMTSIKEISHTEYCNFMYHNFLGIPGEPHRPLALCDNSTGAILAVVNVSYGKNVIISKFCRMIDIRIVGGLEKIIKFIENRTSKPIQLILDKNVCSSNEIPFLRDLSPTSESGLRNGIRIDRNNNILSNTETILDDYVNVKLFGTEVFQIRGTSQPEKYHNIVYKISRPEIDDRTYIGVHSTNNLNDGYMGSGRRIKNSILKHGLIKHVKQVLFDFKTREEALSKEAELVHLGENSLNLIPGGKEVSRFDTTNYRIMHKPGVPGWRSINPNLIEKFISNGYFFGTGVEMKKIERNGTVKNIPVANLEKFLKNGWNEYTPRGPKTGKLEIIKHGERKCVSEDDAILLIKNDGWQLGRIKLSSAPEQVIRVAKALGLRIPANRIGNDGYVNPPKPKNKKGASTGKFCIKKDGTKKMVSREDAIEMVKNGGWQLGAASCWRLASDAAKQLGRELGYDVE